MSASDWYFAGALDAMFCARLGKKPIVGKDAAEVLRRLVAAAGEADLTWLASAKDLDTLRLCGASFEIMRKGTHIQWVVSTFGDAPKSRGFADTIGSAIDALVSSASSNYSPKIPAQRG